MESVLDRIKKFADNQQIKITTLERSVGASKGVLSRALQNNTDIQLKWIQKIVENYQPLSAEWLLTGQGEMFKNIEKKTEQESEFTIKELLSIIKSQQETIKILSTKSHTAVVA